MKRLLLPLILVCILFGCSGNSGLQSHMEDAITNTDCAIKKIEEMQQYLTKNHIGGTRVSSEEIIRSLMPLASEASGYAKKAQVALERAVNCTKNDDWQEKIHWGGGSCYMAANNLAEIYRESASIVIYNILESQKGSLIYANKAAKEILSNL